MEFGNFEITKREILASISIVAFMLLVGLLIFGKISEIQMDQNEKYNKALWIEDSDLFRYGMDTDAGNAFVYGKLSAVDTVTYPEIDGSYMYTEKVKECYTMHTRTTAYRDANGHTRTRTEVYWTWDYAGSENLRCREVEFCGIIFQSEKIIMPESEYITTIKESRRVRYKYYGVATEHVGTAFTKLKDGTISDDTVFYEDRTIRQTVKALESEFWKALFWIFWIILTGALVIKFYRLDNKWLEG